MTLVVVAIVLLAVAVILLGAMFTPSSKAGWAAVVIALIALLLVALNGFGVHVGR